MEEPTCFVFFDLAQACPLLETAEIHFSSEGIDIDDYFCTFTVSAFLDCKLLKELYVGGDSAEEVSKYYPHELSRMCIFDKLKPLCP